MDRQWRPAPPPNVCPSCFHPHFPFCPPPPPYYHPHPPFPYANFKRPRIDDNPINFSDDERRLKLIRDHGFHTYAPHPNHKDFPPHNAQFRSSPHPFHAYPDPSQHRVPDAYHHAHAPHVAMHEGNHQHNFNGRVVHYPYPYPAAGNNSNDNNNNNNMEPSRFFRGQPQPPLPSSPPPPLPMEPSMNQLKPPSLFPVAESQPMSQPYYHPSAFPSEQEASKQQYLGDSQSFSLNQLAAERPKVIDASHLFRHPHRASRPDHFVIIFRGLPGSGKSYLAKMLRDLEVENGGDAPRIHSMDDYFMTEVEDGEASKSSSSGRNKKPVTKKVMEYCYEPEMEEAYRSSMLKAFKKNVEEGVFTFIIVDDRNLRVADFAQFWATAKRSGYEVYILEATYKDPVGCAARNVHGFTQEDIEKMSKQWEEASSLYLQLDVKSLFHGDDLKESRIQEVDMDMEDDLGDALPPFQGKEDEKVVDPPVGEDASFLKAGKNWHAEEEHPTEVRELGKSKWSEDFGEDDIDQTEGMKGNINALSGLIHQYGKERKSVHWGDKGGKTGFSIGAARKVNALSLVIGPGAGYNLKSNPLPEEDSPTRNSVESKKHSIFQEQIRAERESFKAVFDRRRHRIGGLDVEED
ncbi:hypothetical protein AAZX31_17G094700 [Glycine max]|uniref:YLP motif-containing protein 1 n=2 Tax=Glycine subgen. Soja TaxID=1462606 RepID=K7MKV0_SOYBN|nr:uncharacterized protein LOC100804293 isoform X3 [Glycine max]XP_028210892.1 uncharacterized protein LOC114393691 isoform X3 [Glycine soja]KAH1117703.1 hypothetical protein GYH30_046796 [Glycine max]KRH03432.1 hypothetical protein GLYMA_17G097500v4 [Glycine max]RZB56128.1 YLP motif-containing protein 1 isoform B [Glycine soja]|eukprot:XP_006600676.1 uncharacterized protein LOC100804293 isoform X3 [Glycine max]